MTACQRAIVRQRSVRGDQVKHEDERSAAIRAGGWWRLLRDGGRVLGLRVLRPRLLSGRAAAPARLADLADLQRHHGLLLRQRACWWSSSATPSASLGARACVLIGAVSRSRSRWRPCPSSRAPVQLFAVYLVMAVGWATMSVGAITNILGLWFDAQARARHQPGAQRRQLQRRGHRAGAGVPRRRRGLYRRRCWRAPPLILVLMRAAGAHAILAARARRRTPDAPPARQPAAAAAAAAWTRAAALRSRAFWSVSAPFSLSLMSQAGFLVHHDRLPGADHRPQRGRHRRGDHDRHGHRRPPGARHASPTGIEPAPRQRPVARQPGRRAGRDDADRGPRHAAGAPAPSTASRSATSSPSPPSSSSASSSRPPSACSIGLSTGDQPVHLRLRPRPARPRARRHRRLHRRRSLVCIALNLTAAAIVARGGRRTSDAPWTRNARWRMPAAHYCRQRALDPRRSKPQIVPRPWTDLHKQSAIAATAGRSPPTPGCALPRRVLIGTVGSVGMWAVRGGAARRAGRVQVARADASLPYTLAMLGFGVGAVAHRPAGRPLRHRRRR